MIHPTIHKHAAERLQERFGVDKSWLLEQLEAGNFVWLKGKGSGGDAERVRSGHLIFVPATSAYCVVVVDDRSRLAITVLTEDMARHSSWGFGLDEVVKLRAKRIALGESVVDDSQVLHVSAEIAGAVTMNVMLRTFKQDWTKFDLKLFKANITVEQIDVSSKICKLSDEQNQQVISMIQSKLMSKEIKPYGEVFLKNNNGKTIRVSDTFENILGDFADGELTRRWL